MIRIIADTHTHTLATDHAYSTITENAAAAAEKGLQFLALTEHSPSLPGGPSPLYFSNLKLLPRYLKGVMLIKGIEVNIMDYNGSLDLRDELLGQLEWVIASMHTPNIKPASTLEHTSCWVKVAWNPLVDVLGHCGDGRYGFEHKTVLKEVAKAGKIVEINSHSFGGRPGSKENCPEIALLCAEYGIPIVVSSDAHFHEHVGHFTEAIAMLEEIRFPEQLILNADYDRFLKVMQQRTGKELTDEK